MVKKVKRKSLVIRESGRSTDFISPSFGHGCLYNCTYCYMKRHKPEGLSIAINTDDILNAIDKHTLSLGKKLPNQTHEKFWTYDISCNEDFALHLKHHDWLNIFNYFTVESENSLGSFATKYVNRTLLDYNPHEKIRIRMSLMPEEYRKVLEPETSNIKERIEFINELKLSNYDVHINFSPIIVSNNSLELYKDLFEQINSIIYPGYKSSVLAEAIFLTHNENKHLYNVENNLPGEDLLWKPDIQESKKSQYGGINIRYKWQLKNRFIEKFTQLHDNIISWNKIRYIF